MQKKYNNNAAYYLSIVLLLLFVGCSVQQTHKTLTFFFDGVDKVIFFNDYLSKDSLSKDAVAKRDAVLKKNRPDLCVHKPYKEKRCDECHTPDKRLLMPMPGLCYKCHPNFNESFSVAHGPVASGNCTNCHNQHSSKYAKLLIRQGQQLCLFCHASSLVFASKVHRDIEDAECTLCHMPHGGNSKYMVKHNISRDANRIALMNELTYRHVYGQVYCKVPGDIRKVMEITVLDSRGVVVSTAHPDMNGKFYLSNLHPDQNYTFRFKNDFPDCKVNILDNAGTTLYTVERNKKGKYAFDKAAYETVHTIINDAHTLADTLVAWHPATEQQPVVTADVTSDAPLSTHAISISGKFDDTVVNGAAAGEQKAADTVARAGGVATVTSADTAQRNITTANEEASARYAAAVKQFIGNDNAVLFTKIYFEKTKAVLTPEGRAELDKVTAYLKTDNAVKAYLASNADERGTDGFNLQLSVKRAKAATDYLISKGIKKDRIKAKGFGKTYSIYSNKLAPVTEDEYKKDRRVDIYTADK